MKPRTAAWAEAGSTRPAPVMDEAHPNSGEAVDYARSRAPLSSTRTRASPIAALCLQLARLRQHGIGTADLELARSFDIQHLDDAVDHQHRVALRPHPHAL